MLEKYSSSPVCFERFASTAFIAFIIFPPSLLGFPQSVKMFCPGFQQWMFTVFHVKHFRGRVFYISRICCFKVSISSRRTRFSLIFSSIFLTEYMAVEWSRLNFFPMSS